MQSSSKLLGSLESRGLVLIVLAVAWFYTWTATSAYQGLDFKPGDLEYYRFLTDGFLEGRLSLKFEGDPGIAKLSDPYDPAQNAPFRILDISYYKGRYYIYFGPTPVLVLMMPWKLLTGFHLPTRLGAVFFCVAGYVTSIALLLGLRRRFFPEVTCGPVWLAAVVLGLANMAPALLRRPAIYELAIACAYAFVMLAFYALLRVLDGGRSSQWWLALASAAYGLAILARPTCLFGAVIFVPVLIHATWSKRGGFQREGWRWLASAAVPLGTLFGAMLLYNYLRFGNPFEFGQIYQLTSRDMGKVKAFSWSYLPFNAWLYLLMPAQHSAYFPFFLNGLPPPMPVGYDGLDDLYGMIPNLPVVLLALGLLPGLRFNSTTVISGLGIFSALLAIWFLAVFGIFLFFSGATIRYYLDFLPALLLLSCMGFWSLLIWLRRRPLWRRLAWGAIGGSIFLSGIFAIMVSFQHANILRTFNPAAFARLAMRLNLVSRLYDRLAGTTYGPIKAELTFPRGQMGQFQPLLVSGAYPTLDYLWVLYTDDTHVRIGYEHTNHGGDVTQPIRIDYGSSHLLEIDLGFLYPPQHHPFFSGRAAEAEQRTHRLQVVLDGVPYLDKRAVFYDPVSARVKFGESPKSTAFGTRFTGEVRSVQRTPAQPVVDMAPRPGVVEMAVTFPQDRVGQREPLVVTGITGHGDLFYVEYLDQRHVRFGLDHWGVGMVTSEPVTIVPGYIQILEIGIGSLFPAEQTAMKNRLVVRMNGDTVLDRETAFHAVPLSTQTFGSNTIGGSTCGPAFTGKIVSIKRRNEW